MFQVWNTEKCYFFHIYRNSSPKVFLEIAVLEDSFILLKKDSVPGAFLETFKLFVLDNTYEDLLNKKSLTVILISSLLNCNMLIRYWKILKIHKIKTDANFKFPFLTLLVTKPIIPAGDYLFKVNNRNTKTRCEICSTLTIKTPERRLWRHGRTFSRKSSRKLVSPWTFLQNSDKNNDRTANQ